MKYIYSLPLYFKYILSGVVVALLVISIPAQASDSSAIDTDGDTFADCVEKGKYREDHDNDGISDDKDDTVDKLTVTVDRDVDGIPDFIEKGKYRKNHDNDNRKDAPDLDDDNDGLFDKTEARLHRRNHDNDTTKDKRDDDDDNDGILDLNESSCSAQHDHDNDAEIDKKDDDDDDDGIEDHEDEHEMDHDNDGTDDVDDRDDSSGEENKEEDEEEPNDDTDQEDDDAQTVDVAIQNASFSPETITVSVGDVIRWTNSDSFSHTASEENGVFNTGTLEAGESKTITMSTSGTYEYFCAFHTGMTGTVVVQE